MKTLHRFLQSICVAVLLSFPPASEAKETVFLIGGGDMLTASGAAIEKNSAWILTYLKSRNDGYNVQVFFTDGNDPGPDVFQGIEPSSTKDFLKIVFGKDRVVRYLNSRLADQVETTAVDNVKQRLEHLLPSQGTDGGAMLIYQGHGNFEPQDTNRNYLRLWQETRLPAFELSKILDEAHRGSRFRFLFTQCYSGSFARLIYRGMDPGQGLTPDTRCGFVSQLDYLPSEGCSASVDEETYRDYSTYFFEALNGVRRTGAQLPENPDSNGDGQVSLKEAHVYTLRNAYSVDYSMSTSEVYLHNWNKWYTRWLPVKLDRTNEYYQSAVKIATDRGLLSPSLVESRHSRHALLAGKRAALQQAEKELKELDDKYRDLRANLATSMGDQWPWLQGFVEGNRVEDREHEFQAIKVTLDQMLAQSGFIELHSRIALVKGNNIDEERQIAQIVKIDRMLEMARLQTLFQAMANKKEKQEYQRLLRCEESFL